MRLPRFEHLSPKTIKEACSLLSQYGDKARVIAGGTDLLVRMKGRAIAPEYLIQLRSIPRLDHIEANSKGVRIGALATIKSIVNSPVIQERFPFLADAAGKLGTVQIRNMGTIGGNLCNAAPSADTAPPLICLGARAKIVGSQGERVIALEEFFTGPGQTVLKPNEILAEIQIDNPPAGSGASYLKLTRTAIDQALVAVGVLVALASRGGPCSHVRLAMGAVGPTPLRARKAEAALEGRKPTEAAIEETGRLAATEAKPRSSPDYKREMVAVLTRRALKQALEQAKSA